MSSLFLRISQHLLPTGQAWRTTIDKPLRRLIDGFTGAMQAAKDFADNVFLDAFPDSTRELAEWEAQFGLDANPDDATRRLNLAAEWAATGGQSPSYIQGVLQTAGFNVFVYDWWSSGPPYVARDPRSYTTRPLIGSFRCHAGGATQPVCRPQNSVAPYPQAQCNAFLGNDPHYFNNKDLTPRPPPPIPDDPNFWPFFIYIGGSPFGTFATIPTDRRGEFERLILKLRPTQLWIVTLVTYSGIFDDSFDLSFN